jgi:hypothetical protein
MKYRILSSISSKDSMGCICSSNTQAFEFATFSIPFPYPPPTSVISFNTLMVTSPVKLRKYYALQKAFNECTISIYVNDCLSQTFSVSNNTVITGELNPPLKLVPGDRVSISVSPSYFDGWAYAPLTVVLVP